VRLGTFSPSSRTDVVAGEVDELEGVETADSAEVPCAEWCRSPWILDQADVEISGFIEALRGKNELPLRNALFESHESPSPAN
jgi:hypothetical protein